MSLIGQRTRSSRGLKRDTGASSSMSERQEERVLSSAQLTLVKAQARRIAREELSAATGIGELVRQMVEDEVLNHSALRSSGKLIPPVTRSIDWMYWESPSWSSLLAPWLHDNLSSLSGIWRRMPFWDAHSPINTSSRSDVGSVS